MLASLGCGNPIAIAELHEGETVLDLGSGGGIDVLLSARRVGPTGLAYGLDMTDEMLDLARRNQAEAGVTNVQWLRGHIEEIPLPRDSVDVIISNCVINLSGDKPQVLREAARVLKPGGRFAVSDVVADDDMDDATRADMQAYTGCIAGALTRDEFTEALQAAGLTDITITETHRVHPAAISAIVRATKPAGGTQVAIPESPGARPRRAARPPSRTPAARPRKNRSAARPRPPRAAAAAASRTCRPRQPASARRASRSERLQRAIPRRQPATRRKSHRRRSRSGDQAAPTGCHPRSTRGARIHAVARSSQQRWIQQSGGRDEIAGASPQAEPSVLSLLLRIPQTLSV